MFACMKSSSQINELLLGFQSLSLIHKNRPDLFFRETEFHYSETLILLIKKNRTTIPLFFSGDCITVSIAGLFLKLQ